MHNRISRLLINQSPIITTNCNPGYRSQDALRSACIWSTKSLELFNKARWWSRQMDCFVNSMARLEEFHLFNVWLCETCVICIESLITLRSACFLIINRRRRRCGVCPRRCLFAPFESKTRAVVISTRHRMEVFGSVLKWHLYKYLSVGGIFWIIIFRILL